MALAALLVACPACSSESDDDPAASTTTEEEPGDEPGGGTATTGDGEAEGETEGETDAEADAEDEAEPLGTATARLPASPNDSTLVPLRLDVVALERLEGMVELRVELTNEGGDSAPDFEPYSSFDDARLPTGEGTYSLSGAQLVDAEEERAYLTVVDGEGTCLCTGRLAEVAVAPGDSFEMHADFGAVPDDLDQVHVQVPGFPTVDAVPIG